MLVRVSLSGNEQILAKDTRIKLIAKMMAMDHKNIKSQRFALKTLANLAADKDVRAYIGVWRLCMSDTQIDWFLDDQCAAVRDANAAHLQVARDCADWLLELSQQLLLQVHAQQEAHYYTQRCVLS